MLIESDWWYLLGANKEALAVAKAAGADFIRAEGFVYSHIADEGWMDSCAGELLRYRKAIGAEEVLVLTDVMKKHWWVLMWKRMCEIRTDPQHTHTALPYCSQFRQAMLGTCTLNMNMHVAQLFPCMWIQCAHACRLNVHISELEFFVQKLINLPLILRKVIQETCRVSYRI